MADTIITDNHSTDQNNNHDDDENNSTENGHEETMSNCMKTKECEFH